MQQKAERQRSVLRRRDFQPVEYLRLLYGDHLRRIIQQCNLDDYSVICRELLSQCIAVGTTQRNSDLNWQRRLARWWQYKAFSIALALYVIVEAFEFRISKGDAYLFDRVPNNVV